MKVDLESAYRSFAQLYASRSYGGVAVAQKPKVKIPTRSTSRDFVTPKNLLTLPTIELRQIINHRLRKLEQPTLDRLTLLTFAELERFHDNSARHSARVAIYSSDIGTELGLSTKQIAELLKAGLLHDIGKLEIPIEILTLPREANEEEYDLLKKHPEYGAQILKEKGFPKYVIDVAYWHHVWLSKEHRGELSYPEVNPHKVFPYYAQLVEVADVFDASTEYRRTYQDGLPEDEAIKDVLLKDTPNKFNPGAVQALILARSRICD